jgi:hypothetical protein
MATTTYTSGTLGFSWINQILPEIHCTIWRCCKATNSIIEEGCFSWSQTAERAF